MKKLSIFFLICLMSIGLAGCTSQQSTPTSTVVKDSSEKPTSTFTPKAVSTIAPTPIIQPIQEFGDLKIMTYELEGAPDFDSLSFTTVDGQTSDVLKSMDQGSRFPDRSFFDDMHYCLGNELNGSELKACEFYSQDGKQGWVTVTENGEEILRVETGPGSPLTPLQGLWVYGNHWVLEAALITQQTQGNEVNTNAVGQLYVDGDLLNERNGYSEVFGFQTINEKPFYFYDRDGQIGLSYAGKELSLEFDQIPHYGCCSAGAVSPQGWTDHVNFFGMLGEKWYYIRAGEFDQ